MPLNNVMLDLETWGTCPGCAIRSIGAVTFDPYGTSTGDEFYLNIEDGSCAVVGLTKDPSTVAWWNQPDKKEARASLLVDPVPLREVAIAFNAWWRKARGIFLWSQGANFDEVLWAAALRAVDHAPPWKFYDARDTRTAYDMAQFNSKTVKRAGTYHNALDDAKHQVACVQAAYRRVNQKLM